MATSNKPRVLMDSCALLALIKDEPGARQLDGLMEMIDEGSAQLIESVIVLGEVFKESEADDESVREQQNHKLQNIRLLLESPDVQLLDVTPPIVRLATQFRRNRKPKKLPDAIHLATAILNNCDWLVTFDSDFPDVAELKTYRLNELQESDVTLPWALPVQDTLFQSPNNVLPLY